MWVQEVGRGKESWNGYMMWKWVWDVVMDTGVGKCKRQWNRYRKLE